MVEGKKPKLVGSFIRERREKLGLSQRSLGLLFSPPVTTQFISNLERGVTPLPPVHLSTLTKALEVNEAELMGLLEKEYSMKLSGRVGGGITDVACPNISEPSDPDYDFIRNLYNAYRMADAKTRETFASVCESILKLANRPEDLDAASSSGSSSALPVPEAIE